MYMYITDILLSQRRHIVITQHSPEISHCYENTQSHHSPQLSWLIDHTMCHYSYHVNGVSLSQRYDKLRQDQLISLL